MQILFQTSLISLVYDEVKNKLAKAYAQLSIGDPLDENNHVGPLIDKDAVEMYLTAIEKAKSEGGNVLVEGGVLEGKGYESGCYVKPVIIEAENHYEIVQDETFAPILYIMKYSKDFLIGSSFLIWFPILHYITLYMKNTINNILPTNFKSPEKIGMKYL